MAISYSYCTKAPEIWKLSIHEDGARELNAITAMEQEV